MLSRESLGGIILTIGIVLAFIGAEGLFGYNGFTLYRCGRLVCIRPYGEYFLEMSIGVPMTLIGMVLVIRGYLRAQPRN